VHLYGSKLTVGIWVGTKQFKKELL